MTALPPATRALVIHRHGGPDVRSHEEVTRPQPGPGEALIRIRATSLNRLDLWARGGPPGPVFPWKEPEFPIISGGATRRDCHRRFQCRSVLRLGDGPNGETRWRCGGRSPRRDLAAEHSQPRSRRSVGCLRGDRRESAGIRHSRALPVASQHPRRPDGQLGRIHRGPVARIPWRGGEIEPVIDHVYPLSQAADAYRRIEARQGFGKVVLTID